MSHYLDFKTVMTDADALKRALAHMPTGIHRNGIPEHAIEVHENATHLYGYQADKRSQTANVIVRRKDVDPGANDIGFVKDADGTYQAIISEFDSRNAEVKLNSEWLTKLSSYYNYEKSKIELEARKIPYEETKDETGRLQLRCKFKKKNKNGVSISL